MADGFPVELTTPGEDAPKATWDFWYTDGRMVESFDDVCSMLGVDAVGGAAIVMNYPYPEAVPIPVLMGAQRVLRS